MTTEASPLAGLFESSKKLFEELRAELAAYDLVIDPKVELREGEGLLCYYDLEGGHIHLSLPDPSTPLGVFQTAVFRSVLACPDDAELARLVSLLLPSLLAHELGHYFRHQAGKFGTDLWFEEQVANQFAAALTERRLAPDDRDVLVGMLRRTLEHLSPKVGSEHIAVASYIDPLQALGASGVLDRAEVRGLELLESLFTIAPEQILRAIPRLSPEASARLQQRKGTIESFNEDYSAGLARYVYFQFGWMLIELESPELRYVDEIATRHLGREHPLLPEIDRSAVPDAEHVISCYRAHRALAPKNPALGRYFFKRYRSLLLDKLAAQQLPTGPMGRLDVDARRILEAQDDAQTTLDLLSVLASPEHRRLFPNALATEPPESVTHALVFACETDARLWRLASEGANDTAAEATLARLTHLDQSDVYRRLPAELLVKITHLLHMVIVAPGDVLIWEGSANDDVFMLLRGELDVLVGTGGEQRRVSVAHAGEVVGDMAFVSGAPRSATLRATSRSEALVLRSSALRILAFENPALPMQIARVLAERLAAVQANLVS